MPWRWPAGQRRNGLPLLRRTAGQRSEGRGPGAGCRRAGAGRAQCQRNRAARGGSAGRHRSRLFPPSSSTPSSAPCTGASACGATGSAADYTVAEPRGVAVLLTPWNDPVAVACGLIGAALATGNTVIHKPSERCPRAGRGARRGPGAGLPARRVPYRSRRGGRWRSCSPSPRWTYSPTWAPAHPARGLPVRAALTGAHVHPRERRQRSPAGGRATSTPSGQRSRPPSAPSATAARSARLWSGSTSTGTSRNHSPRRSGGGCAAQQQRIRGPAGGPADARRGPRAGHRSPRSRAPPQWREATCRTARDAFYPATVLVDCTGQMQVMTEETFGPVAPVQVVDSFDDGLRLACSGKYGLAATVLSSNIAHIQQAVAALPGGNGQGQCGVRRRSGRRSPAPRRQRSRVRLRARTAGRVQPGQGGPHRRAAGAAPPNEDQP